MSEKDRAAHSCPKIKTPSQKGASFLEDSKRMNKKIKCAMSLAAVAALSVCVLTGCTGDKDKDPADSQTPDVSQSAQVDESQTPDSSSTPDASEPDASAPDASAPDGSVTPDSQGDPVLTPDGTEVVDDANAGDGSDAADDGEAADGDAADSTEDDADIGKDVAKH